LNNHHRPRDVHDRNKAAICPPRICQAHDAPNAAMARVPLDNKKQKARQMAVYQPGRMSDSLTTF